jgi:hypothetical protein
MSVALHFHDDVEDCLMYTVQNPQSECKRRSLRLIASLSLLSLAFPAFGQQDYVSRFDAYVGYAFLDSPDISLFENGFNAQLGFRPTTWYSIGLDYSLSSGDFPLTPGLLTNALQQSLGAQLGQLATQGLVPPGFSLAIPTHARTQTFAMGPELTFRHFRHETLFLRPLDVGAVYEQATLKPSNAIATAVVAQLAPSGRESDVTWFLGAGGGIDVLFSHHFALRTQVDVVYNQLFNDVLKNGRWTVRFSTGPAFNFGKNIKE